MPDGLSSREFLLEFLVELPDEDVLLFLGMPLGIIVGLADGDLVGIPDESFLTGIPDGVLPFFSDADGLPSLLGILQGELRVGIPDFCISAAVAVSFSEPCAFSSELLEASDFSECTR